MIAPRAAGAVPIAGFYLLYFSATGIILPFLPAYLKSLGLSASQVGVLLALSPFVGLLAPPLWGRLADRTGRHDRVLSILCLGGALSFSGMLLSQRFGSVFASLAVYATFASAVTPMIDSLTLQRVSLQGGNFAHLRLFGSLGFVLSSLAYGLTTRRVDRAAVVVPLALMAVYFLWTLSLRARATPAPARGGPFSGLELLRDRQLAWLLAGTCLHWIACAPYNGSLAIHISALGLPPWVVAVSAALGVLAEIGVMLAYPRFAGRLSPARLLALAFGASAARWAGMALAMTPSAIVLLSLLHGMTFGAFYVASVASVARRVPEEMRASGQALFVAVTFGVGGLVGYLGSGIGYDLLGGHRLFALACGVELLAAALALLRVRATEQTEAEPSGS